MRPSVSLDVTGDPAACRVMIPELTSTAKTTSNDIIIIMAMTVLK